MAKDLVSIYESEYLQNQNVIEEKRKFVPEKEDDETAPKKAKFKKRVKGRAKRKKSMSKAEIGGITYDSFNRSETVFDKILREMNEFSGGNVGSVGGDDDNVFDTNEFDSGEEEGGEQTFTLSELRSMTLGEIVDLLGGGEEELDFDDSYEPTDDFAEEDDVPSESVNYPGVQGKYDGKAQRQPATSHVKGNGDADFSKAETDYDPDEEDANDESNYKGDQGNYDGKANRQSATSHVKGNGDADFGKAKTGYKVRSGKKEKNYF